MSHGARKMTEGRLRKMAVAMVDMMQGIYEWPDGRPRRDNSGAPRVEKQELLRMAGYSIKYNARGRALFEDPYFKEQVALELTRREQAFMVATAKNDVSLLGLGTLMMHELHVRMTRDPGSLSTEQLCKYGPTIYKVGADIEAKKHADSQRKRDPKALRGIFAQQVVIMGDEQRESVQKGLEAASSERISRMQTLVSGLTALREEEEVDVIDGEASELEEPAV
jgi:hypothetical protein